MNKLIAASITLALLYIIVASVVLPAFVVAGLLKLVGAI